MGFLDGARLQKPQTGVLLAYENPGGRITAGAGFAAMAIISFVSAAVAPSFGRVGLAVFGVIMLALAARAATGSVLKVAPPELVLRWPFQTRRIPLSDVDRCQARCDAKGLMAVRCYPEVVLKNGDMVRFNAVQWPPKDSGAAESACENITVAVRSASGPRR
jgi:hypothetical protein